MMREYRVCQFCRQLANAQDMTYYALRHWAHEACLIENLTDARVRKLKAWQLERLPAVALEEFGMLDLVQNELAQRREAA